MSSQADLPQPVQSKPTYSSTPSAISDRLIAASSGLSLRVPPRRAAAVKLPMPVSVR